MLVYRGWPTTPGYIGSVTSHHEDPYKTNQDSMEGHKGFECCSYCAEGSSTHQFGETKKPATFSQLFGGSTNGSPREISAMISPHFLGKYSTLLLLFCNMRVDFVRSHEMVTESTLNPPLVWAADTVFFPRSVFKKNYKMVEMFTTFGIRSPFFWIFGGSPFYKWIQFC